MTGIPAPQARLKAAAGMIDLPVPPLSLITGENAYRVGEAVLIALNDGQRRKGALLSFRVERASVFVRLDSPTGLDAKEISFKDIRMLHVLRARKLVRPAPALEERGKVVMPPERQEFEVVFGNGEKLTGHTFSFRMDQNGLHLYPAQETGEYTHMFIPSHAIKTHRVGPLLGKALVKDKLVSPAALKAELTEQQKLREQPIGEYLKSARLVAAKELEAALKRQKSMPQLRLGEVLVRDAIITEAQLADALRQQENNRKVPLGELLVAAGLVTADAIRQTLAKKMGIPFVNLREFEVDIEALKLIPEEIARKQVLLPLYVQDGRIVFAIEDPMRWQAVEAVRFCTKLNAEAVMATATDIDWALNKYYGRQRTEELLEDLDLVAVEEERDDDAPDAQAAGEDKPIVRFVNNILLEAVNAHASDIHIRPGTAEVELLYRIHGELRPQRSIAKGMLAPLVSRIKIMGRMNIAERRRPQDGRIRIKIADRVVDFRVSVIPTVKGESVVIRVLEKSAKLQTLESVGFAGRDLVDLVDLLHRNAGIILVTGATGSGKSSTLYAALQKLVERNLHVISIEEPVEAEMAGVEQIQVNNAAGYTFALALRNILRHDPDAIMVGEIRDQETAKIALESAMTGHLVLSTLHTNDAPSTIARVLEMGIEPYLLSAALLGVVSQRLVRLNCPHCAKPEQVAREIAERLGVPATAGFMRSSGCKECNNTGTAGRTLAYELLRVTPAMRRLINEERPATEIREQANRDGMADLTRRAIEMAEQGRITLEQAYLVKQG